jgi:hypothetical protein
LNPILCRTTRAYTRRLLGSERTATAFMHPSGMSLIVRVAAGKRLGSRLWYRWRDRGCAPRRHSFRFTRAPVVACKSMARSRSLLTTFPTWVTLCSETRSPDKDESCTVLVGRRASTAAPASRLGTDWAGRPRPSAGPRPWLIWVRALWSCAFGLGAVENDPFWPYETGAGFLCAKRTPHTPAAKGPDATCNTGPPIFLSDANFESGRRAGRGRNFRRR